MRDENKTKKQLIKELTEARTRLAELEGVDSQDRGADKALGEMDVLYQALVENSPSGICVIQDKKFRFVNNRFAEMLGYTSEELVEIPVMDLIHPDGKELVAKAIEISEQESAVQDIPAIQFRAVTKKGKTLWLETFGPHIEFQGRPAVFVNTLELADRRLIEEHLRFLYSAIEQSTDGIAIVDLEGNLLFLNKAFASLHGYSQKELLGKHFSVFYTASQMEAVEVANRQIMETGEFSGEIWHARRDGSLFPTLMQNSLLRDEDGDATGMITTMRDITDLKRMQEQLYRHREQLEEMVRERTAELTQTNRKLQEENAARKKTEEALRLSEERYRRILDSSHDAVVVVDAKANIMYANKAWTEQTGYSTDEVNEEGSFNIVYAEDLNKVRTSFQKVRSGELLRNLEFRIRNKAGESRWVEINAASIQWPGLEESIAVSLHDITDHKRLENELLETKEYLENLLENANDVIYTMDLEGNVTFINKIPEEITGYSREEWMGKSLRPLTHPDDLPKVLETFDKVISGQPQSSELRYFAKSGEILTFSVNEVPVFRNGIVIGIFGIARDITQHRQAEKALQESEEKYRDLVENMNEVIYSVDADIKLTYVSPAIKPFTGYEPEETIGKTITDFVCDKDLPRMAENANLALSGLSQSNEYRILTKAGETRWIRTSSHPIFENDQIVGAQGMMEDITDRRQAEKALRESEKKFRSLVEITADWVWETDKNGKYDYASPKVKDLLGYEPEEMLGKTAFAFIDNAKGDHSDRNTKGHAKSQEPLEAIESTHLHKDGRQVVLETNAIPITDPDGNYCGYRGIDRNITYRKRAEEALKESEEKYRNIFQEAPDIFYMLDLESQTITDANKQALATLGYGFEMIGKTQISDIIHPDDYDRAMERLMAAIEKKDRTPDFSLRFLTKEGKVRHVEQSGVIFWDENGQARNFLGLAHDVTQRKEQEETIRKRNRELAALHEVAKAANESLGLDTLLELMLEVIPRSIDSSSMAILSFNESAQEFQYLAHKGLNQDSRTELQAFSANEGLHEYLTTKRKPKLIDNIQEYPQLLRTLPLRNTGIESVIAVPLMIKNRLLGSMFVSRPQGHPFTSEDLNLVTAMARQIAASMENAYLYSELLQREAHLQSILDTSRDGIAVLSSDRRTVYRNKAMSSIFGYDESEDLSDVDTSFFFAPESLPVLENIRERIKQGSQIAESIVFKGKKKDGSTFDAEVRLGYFIEKGRRCDVAILRDVTERNRMEYQLHQANKLAAIGELAAGVAHEINNPIATIDVQTGLMREIVEDERDKLAGVFSEKIDEYFDTVEDQVQRCRSVTTNLLSFSRAPESKEQSIAVNELLKRTVDLIGHLTDKKPRVEMRLSEKLPQLLGDPNRLEQVFVNLMNNAIKAIEAGGSISISTNLDTNKNIRIEFRDSGPGITPEIRERIFDPFFTTSPENEGTGLGLSITYYIIKEMNGTIDVESRPGEGAVFVITLPSEDLNKGITDYAS